MRATTLLSERSSLLKKSLIGSTLSEMIGNPTISLSDNSYVGLNFGEGFWPPLIYCTISVNCCA